MMAAEHVECFFTHGHPVTPKREAKSSHSGGMM
jgi:hypothetical protein